MFGWFLNCFTFSDIGDIKKELYDMLTQPIPIGVTDEDEMNNHKPNTNIDQIIQRASDRVSVELTDQLWDCLKGKIKKKKKRWIEWTLSVMQWR